MDDELKETLRDIRDAMLRNERRQQRALNLAVPLLIVVSVAAYIPLAILIPVLTFVGPPLTIWLTVRFFNRREQWVKWTLAAIIGLPVLYILSIRPAMWLSHYGWISDDARAHAALESYFAPIFWLVDSPYSPLYGTWIGKLLSEYVYSGILAV